MLKVNCAVINCSNSTYKLEKWSENSVIIKTTLTVAVKKKKKHYTVLLYILYLDI